MDSFILLDRPKITREFNSSLLWIRKYLCSDVDFNGLLGVFLRVKSFIVWNVEEPLSYSG